MRTKTKKSLTDDVENALLRRALGYTAEETTLVPDEESGERIQKIVRKEVAPNIQAQIYYLKAYRPEIWAKTSPGGYDDSEDGAAELYKALAIAAENPSNLKSDFTIDGMESEADDI
jgi:hypothetical protein